MRKLDMTRMADLLLSTVFILLVLPLWLIVIPVLRFTGEGEVFYRQPRVGKDGRIFDLLKFATMLKNSPNMGTGDLTLHNDPRVLPVGRILRKTKINELPQLFNVWKGEMSIAGPRPQTPRIFALYPQAIQDDLKKMRPGLSGVGPILFRGEEKMLERAEDPQALYEKIIMPYKGEVERWYLNNRSIRSYFLIIFITIWVILFPRSRLAWAAFPGLPTPPKELASFWT
ncbi:lipopolysaccharide/colanic/teichoic acid biosynthesis glycosyltransferase [Rhodovulum bhavnagarense]|uniref:Lipopolysaccharide/colanic/teichoic acid biosynthesis glycosyltransferase n=1 Tax=Rhodovulum bhavnagarense TaxID=992286 RepID=A0A4R2R832_9RHOB|nr:sugar transferase [Rhodovulum bhavnagarense]TCP58783.1 lipopolysaccharide/colanic/teichoic acid biosynthesis glycosyltransferase [Rhodovulum bhavnagarense]